MDGNLSELYSFARLNQNFPIPGGFVHENITEGFYRKHDLSNCSLYKLEIDDKAFDKITEALKLICEKSLEYKYSYLGAFLCFLHIKYRRERRYFCSQFVASLITESGAALLPKTPCLMHPEDFIKINGVSLMFKGTILGLVKKLAESEEFLPAATFRFKT